jgi:hypothetical protein
LKRQTTQKITRKQPAKRPNPEVNIGSVAQALSTYMTGVADRARFKLIEIEPHPDSGTVKKFLLAPANLELVEIHANDVVLYTKGTRLLQITIEEWNRIKTVFGYSEPQKPTIPDFIFANYPTPEEQKTE